MNAIAPLVNSACRTIPISTSSCSTSASARSTSAGVGPGRPVLFSEFMLTTSILIARRALALIHYAAARRTRELCIHKVRVLASSECPGAVLVREVNQEWKSAGTTVFGVSQQNVHRLVQFIRITVENSWRAQFVGT